MAKSFAKTALDRVKLQFERIALPAGLVLKPAPKTFYFDGPAGTAAFGFQIRCLYFLRILCHGLQGTCYFATRHKPLGHWFAALSDTCLLRNGVFCRSLHGLPAIMMHCTLIFGQDRLVRLLFTLNPALAVVPA